MKWRGRTSSSNVEDRRGSSGGGGGGMLPIGGGLGIIIMLIIYLLGGNPLDMMGNQEQQGSVNPSGQYEETAQERELREFTSVVLKDTEDVWTEIFSQYGRRYEYPKLVIYNGQVNSGCGFASSNTGPFYCPADRKVYLDLSFANDLERRFKAPGDFALAYVLAHEVGHHVQTLLGITDQVMPLRNKLPQKEFNKYMVKFELQADYFAGVFAKYIQKKGYLEVGDIEEAINAAGAVGDDRIQIEATGHAVPDTFTHGTSEQRMHWFMKGYELGTIEGGDTFNE